MGQSLAGILGQLYFRRRPERVLALVLTNTLTPKVERCRGWARVLLRFLPFSLLRPLMRRKLSRLGRFDREVPPDVVERRRFAQALMARMLDRAFTRERIGKLLNLAWRFNEAGAYGAAEFRDWKGRVLLVTSEDDSCHADAEVLRSSLPGTQVFTLPTGYGHMAPQICLEEYRTGVQRFIDGLQA
jgi:pimeloyl-ACP methyl ester carboxylesterase